MYKNILVPVDIFSPGLADKALRHAEFLAKSSAGQIHLVNIIQKFSPILTRGFVSDARKMEAFLNRSAKEKLVDLTKKIDLPQDNVHLHIRAGNIRDEVTRAADELEADVIIIGSRNTNIQTHLLGSDAADIVRYARVPVFVIR
ncbi:Universal stress family protein, UspA domain protein [Sodalis praecaptivus]|uniref:Universal stress protein n=1 Tax=Sodalis praecaptivus TaxID=1239307 RepID=W0HQE8_9GAMM|nr:universal stress protein [Sodalis praecaptivus]AHF76071.1 Universal stress family protein, UspA domain protein [Sodalis praecaptivus]